MDFFKPSEINFFKERLKTNRKYQKAVSQDVQDGKRIKAEIFNKTNHWAKTVAEKLNGEFEVIEDNRWNISGYFKEYSWARLYKKNLGDNKVYYTLGIHGDTGALCYKIDCQRDGSNKLDTQQVEKFDQKLKESNINWQEIYPADLEKYNWEPLVTKTVNFIKETYTIFDELNYLVAGRPKSKTIKKTHSSIYPLNQILYGPPGTGKTYQSKSRAVIIIDGNLPDSREKINNRYAELYEKGQIKFVTFHQSTTYEDFVEGIKPVMSEEEEEMGNVQYKIEDGIFKKMCIQAAYEYIKFQEQSQPSSKTLTFSQLFDQLSNNFQQSLDEGKKINIPLKSGNTISVTEISSQGNFILKHVDGQRTYTVSKSRLEKLFNEIEDFDTIPNIYSYFRSIIGGSNASAYWAILNQIYKLSKKSRPVVNPTPSFEDKKRAFERIKWSQIDPKTEVPKYVLIIDEINRGNIAAVLGELIRAR